MLRSVYFACLCVLGFCQDEGKVQSYLIYLNEINLVQISQEPFCLSFMCKRIFEDFSKSLFFKICRILSACFFLNTSNDCCS